MTTAISPSLATTEKQEAIFVAKATLGANTVVRFPEDSHLEPTHYPNIYFGQIVGKTSHYFLQRLPPAANSPEEIVAHSAHTLARSQARVSVGFYCSVQYKDPSHETVGIGIDPASKHPECPAHLWSTHQCLTDHVQRQLKISAASIILPLGAELSYSGQIIAKTPFRSLQKLDREFPTDPPVIVVHDERNFSTPPKLQTRSTIIYQDGHPTAYPEKAQQSAAGSHAIEPENKISGQYPGIIIGQTDTHYLQITSHKDSPAVLDQPRTFGLQRNVSASPESIYAHSKQLDQNPTALTPGQAVTFEYNNGKYNITPAKLPIGAALHATRAALGNPSAEVYAAETNSGVYRGPIIAQTPDHYLQRVSSFFAVMHPKEVFSPTHAAELHENPADCAIRYVKGVVTLDTQRQLTLKTGTRDR